MPDILQHINEKLKGYKDLTLFVACSGGVDSMSLLFALNKLHYKVRAIHVNYNLRGEESLADEQLVEDFCKTNAIPFEKRSIDLAKELKNGGNLQELARNVRYDWFKEINNHGNNSIVLGHHIDDQIETFFLNLGRKSGVMGLAAMPFENNKMLRPLLKLSKDELYTFAKKNSIPWREDRSNASNNYKRNVLRNKIIPALSAEIPTLKESVEVLIEQFQNKQLGLEQRINPLFKSIKAKRQLSIDEYLTLDDFEKVELCRELGCNYTLMNELDKLANAQKGKRITCTPTETAVYSSIIKDVSQFSFTNSLDDFAFSLCVKKTNELPTKFSKEEIYIDESLVQGQLVLRSWKIGDRIQPIGVNGSTLISDIISDAKINAREKERVLVLTDDKNIHWCVGHKIGRLAIATPESNSIVMCSVTYLATQE